MRPVDSRAWRGVDERRYFVGGGSLFGTFHGPRMSSLNPEGCIISSSLGLGLLGCDTVEQANSMSFLSVLTQLLIFYEVSIFLPLLYQ